MDYEIYTQRRKFYENLLDKENKTKKTINEIFGKDGGINITNFHDLPPEHKASHLFDQAALCDHDHDRHLDAAGQEEELGDPDDQYHYKNAILAKIAAHSHRAAAYAWQNDDPQKEELTNQAHLDLIASKIMENAGDKKKPWSRRRGYTKDENYNKREHWKKGYLDPSGRRTPYKPPTERRGKND